MIFWEISSLFFFSWKLQLILLYLGKFFVKIFRLEISSLYFFRFEIFYVKIRRSLSRLKIFPKGKFPNGKFIFIVFFCWMFFRQKFVLKIFRLEIASFFSLGIFFVKIHLENFSFGMSIFIFSFFFLEIHKYDHSSIDNVSGKFFSFFLVIFVFFLKNLVLLHFLP